ncbi:helix-hairpin-helix domain-containing protein [Lacticaseibacillus brantae]|uniref:DNA uptake protein-like DNA-binding protein n=1 Tax=Lacticaseibacillus brantae DSM 23927 TaxID=1423727 RepID=A0A0R2B869_9LACO|nr:helix-hairpin-helix domain-containing protein [Lacticaseibacillus brantae]KRM72553.1 DNA uptake protein-like DNA-binding protein [Lacticaseibacillus brantae DSM 23927]
MDQIKVWVRQYWYLCILGVFGLGLGWWWFGRGNGPELAVGSPAVASVSQSMSSSQNSASSTTSKAGFVHLKGAVKKPGLYPVTESTRWDAVVKAAGGLLPDADLTQVNLAKIASDQETLNIPIIGQSSQASGQASVTSTSGGSINLNSATAEQLQTLSGVGPKKAQDIIAYRDAHGGFKTLDELKSVPGIGDKTFQKFAPQLTLGP